MLIYFLTLLLLLFLPDVVFLILQHPFDLPFNIFMFMNLSMYNTLVSRCFDVCVTSFRSKTLDKSESSCAEQCAARYVKMTQRVGLRFAEHQAMEQKRAEEAAAKAGNR